MARVARVVADLARAEGRTGDLWTGRPLGAEVFVAGLETMLGRTLHRRKPGPAAGQKRGRR